MTKRNNDREDGFRFDLIPAGSAVLCALSGGADSMYLLCRLLEGAAEGGYTVRAAHYDHRLRPASGGDAAFVRDWCGRMGVPLTLGGGDVAAEAARRRLGLEECARQMRYAFLEDTARDTGCTLIATGHHAGDNVETILMNMIRGCGLKGLTGIPERRGDLVRPMLAVSRADIRAYLTAHGVPHVEDESNDDLAYTRNRVRHQLVPLLEGMNPQAVDHILYAAELLREDEAELSRQGAALAERGERTAEGLSIPAELVARAPRPIALRALAELVRQAGGSADRGQLERLLALCGGEKPSARLDLPGCTARRAYDRLILSIPGEVVPPAPAPLLDGENRWGGWVIACAPDVCPAKAYAGPGEFWLKDRAYLIRTRQTGDALRLGHRPVKTVKELMQEGRVPRHLRPLVPVLAADGRAAALGGFGPDWAALAAPGERCRRIRIRKGE